MQTVERENADVNPFQSLLALSLNEIGDQVHALGMGR